VHDHGRPYVETISGELGAQGLDARFALKGKYWGVPADVRANGPLVP
jgi:hypothetical protein